MIETPNMTTITSTTGTKIVIPADKPMSFRFWYEVCKLRDKTKLAQLKTEREENLRQCEQFDIDRIDPMRTKP